MSWLPAPGPRCPPRPMLCPVVLVAALSGCTTGPEDAGRAADCPAPVVSREGVVEVPTDRGSVTALLFGDLPARTGQELKIVWRVTGDGGLTVRAVRPDGSTAEPAFGPEPHYTSNFDAPGDEWGTGFRFDGAGCWRIDVARGGVSASLWVPVETQS